MGRQFWKQNGGFAASLQKQNSLRSLSDSQRCPQSGASPRGGLDWTCPPYFCQRASWDKYRSQEFTGVRTSVRPEAYRFPTSTSKWPSVSATRVTDVVTSSYSMFLVPFVFTARSERQWTAEGSDFGAVSLVFLVCVWNISGTAEGICAKFTWKTCLVLAWISLKVKVIRDKNGIFGPFDGLREVCLVKHLQPLV